MRYITELSDTFNHFSQNLSETVEDSVFETQIDTIWSTITVYVFLNINSSLIKYNI